MTNCQVFVMTGSDKVNNNETGHISMAVETKDDFNRFGWKKIDFILKTSYVFLNILCFNTMVCSARI